MAISEEQRAERIKANARKELDALKTPEELADEALKQDLEKLATVEHSLGLQAEIDALKAENEELAADNKALSLYNEQLKADLSTLQEAHKLVADQNTALLVEKENLDAANVELLNQVEVLTKDVADLKAKGVAKKKTD